MQLQPREDVDVEHRLSMSAKVLGSTTSRTTDETLEWLGERARANVFRVDRIPFADLDGWSFDDGGNLRHSSGKFFSVEGLHVIHGEEPFPEWQQPIIVQPEIGILGILAKEFDGVLHFLMQAKMEPGNPNLLQLSPTVQATRSNYTGVHQGAGVPYLEHFADPESSRVLVDVLQSEHGSWFFRKNNRNMIVETTEDVPVREDFAWLTLGQLGELLRLDNVVNMDSRTVLGCAPVLRHEPGAVLTDTEVVSWFTAERSRHEVTTRLVSLGEVKGWSTGPASIEHEDGTFFRVMAASVAAGSREVKGWTQPLIEPIGTAVAAFLVRRFGGVPHLLAHARVEGGLPGTIELGPSVQCTLEAHDHLPERLQPSYLGLVTGADPSRVIYDAVHSEEGGRFFRAETRYQLIEVDEDEVPGEPPLGFQWLSLGQLSSLVRHNRYVNVQARTLMSLLNTDAARI